MRILIIFFLLIISTELYSQRIFCDSIFKYSLTRISEEIFNNKKYSVEECKCFASRLSDYDKSIGIHRILTYSGIFQAPCLKCLYNSIGFETFDFFTDDISSENIDAFVSQYNGNMKEMISVSIKNKIFPDTVYTPLIPGQSTCQVNEIADTLLNIKMENYTLEKLFGNNIRFIKITFDDTLEQSITKTYDYFTVKFQGIPVKVSPNLKIRNLHITYDLSNVPDNVDICWCHTLEQKQKIILPVKIK